MPTLLTVSMVLNHIALVSILTKAKGGVIVFYAWKVIFVLYLAFDFCIMMTVLELSKASAHRAWVALGHWLWALPVILTYNGLKLFLLTKYILHVHKHRMVSPVRVGSVVWRATGPQDDGTHETDAHENSTG